MVKKEYTNGEVTVVWQPDLCFHSANCVNGLPSVFDANKKPWIDPEGASSSEIIDQIKKCPSGALSYYMNAEGPRTGSPEKDTSLVEVLLNGPLVINGNLTVKHSDGTEENRQIKAAFCRCGQSSNKPYCDGTHRKVDFKG